MVGRETMCAFVALTVVLPPLPTRPRRRVRASGGTLVHFVGHDDVDALHRYPLGDIIREFRSFVARHDGFFLAGLDCS